MTVGLDISVSANVLTDQMKQTSICKAIVPHLAMMFVYLSISMIGQTSVWL